LRDVHAAEDVVQQVFLELTRARGQFRGGGSSLRAWLFRSARFGCLDEVRRRQRRREEPTDQIPDLPIAEPDPFESEDPDLERALSTLTEEQRTVLHLKHVVGLSGTEMAMVVGSNRAAVFALAARAERRLRKLLAPIESEVVAASQLVNDFQTGAANDGS
jgi:RNA polymerase sigma-70 factor (ECF subfamily)